MREWLPAVLRPGLGGYVALVARMTCSASARARVTIHTPPACLDWNSWLWCAPVRFGFLFRRYHVWPLPIERIPHLLPAVAPATAVAEAVAVVVAPPEMPSGPDQLGQQDQGDDGEVDHVATPLVSVSETPPPPAKSFADF